MGSGKYTVAGILINGKTKMKTLINELLALTLLASALTAAEVAFREAWPDWVFDRAIRTDLEGPQGEPYVRLDRLSYNAFEFAAEDTSDPAKRRGPPLHARGPAKVRDMMEGKVQEMPGHWRDLEEERTNK